jgi:hypothetical protein
MLGWLSQLILYFFGKHDYIIISTVSLITLFITWVCIYFKYPFFFLLTRGFLRFQLSVFVATVSSPSRTIYHLRHYSPVFFAFFTFALLDAVYKLLNINDTTWWKYIHVAFCFILFVTSGLIPQPIHPKDVQSAPSEKVEIKDGVIYREVSYRNTFCVTCMITNFLWIYIGKCRVLF